MHTLRSAREIGLIREAGLLVFEAHQIAGRLIRPGVTTAEIDTAVEEHFAEHGATDDRPVEPQRNLRVPADGDDAAFGACCEDLLEDLLRQRWRGAFRQEHSG